MINLSMTSLLACANVKRMQNDWAYKTVEFLSVLTSYKDTQQYKQLKQCAFRITQ